MTEVLWTQPWPSPTLGRFTNPSRPDGATTLLRLTQTRYPVLYALVVVAELLDLATFLPAAAHVGIGAESNPLARTLYLSAGPLGLAALKAAAIAVMLLALIRVARRFPTLALPSASLVVLIAAVGATSNVVLGLLR